MSRVAVQRMRQSPGRTRRAGLLRAERERRGYSVQYAAEDLHLDVWVIEALEANRFEALGAPVYAKGHLRKYATLLGLSPATVLERYEALSGTPLEPTPIPAAIAAPVPQRRSMPKAPLWIAAAIAVAAGVAWLVYELWPIDAAIRRREDERRAGGDCAGADSRRRAAAAAVEQTIEPASSTGSQLAASAPAEVRVRLAVQRAVVGRDLRLDRQAADVRHGHAGPRAHVSQACRHCASTSGWRRRSARRWTSGPSSSRAGPARTGAKFLIEADGSVRPDTSMQTAERE